MLKKKYKIIIYIAFSLFCFGLGAWFEDFISKEKEIKNSPISYEGQEVIDSSCEEEPKDFSEKEVITDTFKFSLTPGESKTVKSENSTVAVSYGADDKSSSNKNLLSSINGIKVNKYGDFEIKIDGIKYHIVSVSLQCPECNYMTSNDYLTEGIGLCSRCGHKFSYNDINLSENSFGMMFYCPDCGKLTSTSRFNNFCEKCGRDLKSDKKRLKEYKWESR